MASAAVSAHARRGSADGAVVADLAVLALGLDRFDAKAVS
jgi:hypothetical protein